MAGHLLLDIGAIKVSNNIINKFKVHNGIDFMNKVIFRNKFIKGDCYEQKLLGEGILLIYRLAHYLY